MLAQLNGHCIEWKFFANHNKVTWSKLLSPGQQARMETIDTKQTGFRQFRVCIEGREPINYGLTTDLVWFVQWNQTWAVHKTRESFIACMVQLKGLDYCLVNARTRPTLDWSIATIVWFEQG